MSDTGNTDLLFATWEKRRREIKAQDHARAASKDAGCKKKVVTQERLKELLRYDPETGLFVRIKARGRLGKVGSIAGTDHKDGYKMIKIDSVLYLSHRLAWLYVYGVWPIDLLDHRNGVRSDNQIENLREATNEKNLQNQRKGRGNGSKYLGVSWSKISRKWMASIQLDKKWFYLGYFSEEEAAYSAYLEAKRKLHEFGTL